MSLIDEVFFWQIGNPLKCSEGVWSFWFIETWNRRKLTSQISCISYLIDTISWFFRLPSSLVGSYKGFTRKIQLWLELELHHFKRPASWSSRITQSIGETIIYQSGTSPFFGGKSRYRNAKLTYKLYGKPFPGGDWWAEGIRMMRNCRGFEQASPKKRCENSEKRMGGKGWKLGDFLVSGILKGKLPGAKQRFWLGEWVKLTEIDQLIDLQTNQSIVFQLIGSTTRLRELHNREGDAKSNLLASYSCWVFGKSGQIWKDSVPLNIHYMLFPPKWIGIINLSLNHLENDHDEQLHPCNPVHLGAQILARISNFADLPSSNEWRTEGNTFKIWFQKTKNPFGKKQPLLSCTYSSCFSNFHMWLPRMASEILRLSLLTSTVGGVRFPPAGGETSSNDELVGLRLWWRTWGARVLEEVDW